MLIKRRKDPKKGEFQKGSRKQYAKARKKGWLSEICKHMVVPEPVFPTEKACTRCNIVKPVEEYPIKTGNKSGRGARCRTCNREVARQRKIDLKCSNCGADFVGHSRDISRCEDCKRKPDTNRAKCEIEAQKYKTRGEFQHGSGQEYSFALRKGILDEICTHMVWLGGYARTDEEIKEEMRKYSSRSGFYSGSPKHCQQALKRDWYSEYSQEIWGDPIEPCGFKRSDFIKKCEQKLGNGTGNGLGMLYLIKCVSKNEVFYKIGITSNSVKKRYGHNGNKTSKTMPYNYEIVWTIQGDPGMIWDMENQYKQETKEIRYLPEIDFCGTTETFKCHGNCKILRKPDAKNTTVGSS